MSEDSILFAILATAAVLIVTQFARLVRAGMQHKTIREAISRDNAAVPHLLAGIEEAPKAAGTSDDRTAFVLIALGVALFALGLIQGDPDDIRDLGGAALFPILVGGALLLRWGLVRRRGDAS